MMFQLDGWTLARFSDAEDDEPRIPAATLAQKLGFSQVRDIRKLIKRMAESGKLPGVCVRDTVSRTQMPTGGARETKVHEYFLNESQAIKVIAKSETDIADKILDEVIRIYIQWRRGTLPGQAQAHASDVTMLGAAISEALKPMVAMVVASFDVVSKRLERIEEQLAKQPSADALGVIGPTGGRWVRHYLRVYAAYFGTTPDERRSWRQSGEQQLRAALGFSGYGRSWDELPLDQYAKARAKLTEMCAMAERVRTRQDTERQQGITYPIAPSTSGEPS